MNRPIDIYTAAQLEADRAMYAAMDAEAKGYWKYPDAEWQDNFCDKWIADHTPQAKPDPVGEWLLIPVMAAIALVGALLMGLRL